MEGRGNKGREETCGHPCVGVGFMGVFIGETTKCTSSVLYILLCVIYKLYEEGKGAEVEFIQDTVTAQHLQGLYLLIIHTLAVSPQMDQEDWSRLLLHHSGKFLFPGQGSTQLCPFQGRLVDLGRSHCAWFLSLLSTALAHNWSLAACLIW